MAGTSSATVALSSCEGLPGAYILYELISRGYRVKVPVPHVFRPEVLPVLWRNVYGHVPDLELVSWIQGGIENWHSLQTLLQDAHYLFHAPDLYALGYQSDKNALNALVSHTARLMDAAHDFPGLKKMIYVSSTAALSRAETETTITEKILWKDHRHNSYYNKALMKAELEVWRGHAEGLDTVILNPGYLLGYSWMPHVIETLLRAKPRRLSGYNAFSDVRDVARMAVDSLHAEKSGLQLLIVSENKGFDDVMKLIKAENGYSAHENKKREKPLFNRLKEPFCKATDIPDFLRQELRLRLNFASADPVHPGDFRCVSVAESVAFFGKVYANMSGSKI